MTMLDQRTNTCSKKGPIHTTHTVTVKNGASPSWRGNLKLLKSASRPKLVVKNGTMPSWRGHVRVQALDWDTDDTENMSCSSSSDYGSDIVYSDKSRGIFSFYQVGDGSAEDPDHIPYRYLDLANQDRDKALELMQNTIDWREENEINDMLNKPHTKFDICKAVIPHFYIGRDTKGHAVYVQQPARLDMKQVKANGLTHDDLLFHAIYIQEYLWQIVEADNPDALCTSIIDAGDLCLSDLRRKQDQLQLLTRMASTFDTHFPLRGHKTFIINAPSWFNTLWRLIKPCLREGTTDMIEICSKGKQQDRALGKHLGKETSKALPDFCWSKPREESAPAVDQLEMEKDLRKFVLSRILAKGETMEPVIS